MGDIAEQLTPYESAIMQDRTTSTSFEDLNTLRRTRSTACECAKYLKIAHSMHKLLQQAELAHSQIVLAKEMASKNYDYVTFKRLESMLEWHENTMELLFLRCSSMLGFKRHRIKTGQVFYADFQGEMPRPWRSSLPRLEHLWRGITEFNIKETYLWSFYSWSAVDYLVCIHKFYRYRLPLRQVKKDKYRHIGWFNRPNEQLDVLKQFQNHIEFDSLPPYELSKFDFMPEQERLLDEDQYPAEFIDEGVLEFPVPELIF